MYIARKQHRRGWNRLEYPNSDRKRLKTYGVQSRQDTGGGSAVASKQPPDLSKKKEDNKMMTYDMEFDFYSDEPPRYFSRPANEFDGYDPKGNEEEEKDN